MLSTSNAHCSEVLRTFSYFCHDSSVNFPTTSKDHVLPINFSFFHPSTSRTCQVYVRKRPGLEQFMATVSQLYEATIRWQDWHGVSQQVCSTPISFHYQNIIKYPTSIMKHLFLIFVVEVPCVGKIHTTYIIMRHDTWLYLWDSNFCDFRHREVAVFTASTALYAVRNPSSGKFPWCPNKIAAWLGWRAYVAVWGLITFPSFPTNSRPFPENSLLDVLDTSGWIQHRQGGWDSCGGHIWKSFCVKS